jgi:hypothetical protein
MESLSEAIRRLVARGFEHGLIAVDGQLRDLATGELFDPKSLSIDEVVRFEGESEPGEQAILFALRSASGGPLGTYTAVYGPAMPAEDAHVVRRLAVRS